MKGCVHVYTGDGKGKTCAAVGLAVRAAGAGLRVGFCQFMKTGASAEVAMLERLGIAVFSPEAPARFVWEMNAAEKTTFAAQQRTVLTEAAARMPRLDLLVLDELICTVSAGLLARHEVEAVLDARPPALELVLTGRGAWPALLQRAHYATEMRQLAHPFETGLAARPGIEY